MAKAAERKEPAPQKSIYFVDIYVGACHATFIHEKSGIWEESQRCDFGRIEIDPARLFSFSTDADCSTPRGGQGAVKRHDVVNISPLAAGEMDQIPGTQTWVKPR